MSTKQWSSRDIFKESDMRNLMSQMYIALTQAGENAKALSTIDAEQIRKIIPVGNPQAKQATRSFLRELEYYKDISNSSDVFERNVLAPIKFSAQLILYMRDRHRATTDLQCWVIAKSYPTYDPQSKQNMVTVTTVCPKIKTTMSVRISQKQADTLDYKIYQFPHVQPIPLANRNEMVTGSSNFSTSGMQNHYEMGFYVRGVECNTVASMIEDLAHNKELTEII